LTAVHCAKSVVCALAGRIYLNQNYSFKVAQTMYAHVSKCKHHKNFFKGIGNVWEFGIQRLNDSKYKM
jgi:hypothetical protein